MEQKARFLARCGVAGATAACILGTLAAQNGQWGLWAVNGVLLLACGGVAVINYRLANRLSGR